MKRILIVSFIIQIILFSIVKFTPAQTVRAYSNNQYKEIVVLNGKLEDEFVNEVVNTVNSLPDSLLRQLRANQWIIYIIEGDVSYKLGSADIQTKSIYIYQNGVSTCETYSLRDTLVHEICHAIDNIYGLSNSKEFIELYKSQKDKFNESTRPISNYHKTNIQEMFACTMKEFILHSDELEQNNKPLYNYMLEVWFRYCH